MKKTICIDGTNEIENRSHFIQKYSMMGLTLRILVKWTKPSHTSMVQSCGLGHRLDKHHSTSVAASRPPTRTKRYIEGSKNSEKNHDKSLKI